MAYVYIAALLALPAFVFLARRADGNPLDKLHRAFKQGGIV